MPELSPEKRLLLDEIENISAQMKDIASAIFDEPELGYQEFKSSARLADFLEDKVFAGDAGIEISPTAEDVAGFNTYIENYKAGLPVEEAATQFKK